MKLPLMTSLLIAFMVSGCCAVTADPVPLQLPPTYQPIKLERGSLDCLSAEAKEQLHRRDKACEQRIKTLEDIIKTTHE